MNLSRREFARARTRSTFIFPCTRATAQPPSQWRKASESVCGATLSIHSSWMHAIPSSYRVLLPSHKHAHTPYMKNSNDNKEWNEKKVIRNAKERKGDRAIQEIQHIIFGWRAGGRARVAIVRFPALAPCQIHHELAAHMPYILLRYCWFGPLVRLLRRPQKGRVAMRRASEIQ